MKSLNIKRTFIVDDDPYWTSMLTEMLLNMGHTNIITFESGKECVENLHLNPNLVFLDYQMEDMDGLEVLQKVKNYYPGIEVIFCTAHEDLSVAVSAIKNGSFDYLLKSNATEKELDTIITNLKSNQPYAEKVY